jgi:hypothetical protein
VAGAVLVMIFAQVFNQLGSYLDYPSTGPLRFGAPYLIVGLAVWAACRPQHARPLRWASLLVVALAALWSFETFVYTIATITAISIITHLAEDGPALRRIVRDLLACLAAAADAIVLFTLGVAIFSGSPTWSPYIDYIRLYEKGFGALPVAFFSTGPLMGALTILSAAGVTWVALERRTAVSVPARTALAGFTGFAMSTYTYYLGRSAANNLVHILPPVASYLTVWASVFLGEAGPARRAVSRPAATAAAAALVLAASAIAVNAWPAVQDKWQDTALAQAVPFADGGAPGSGRSVRQSLQALWDLPVMDARAPAAVALIDRHFEPGRPVLALMGGDLTTEALMRSGRRNLLPISHPLEDDLIASSRGRVLAAVDRLAPGTLMLRSDDLGPAFIDPFPALEQVALDAIRRRFRLHTVDRVETVRVMRLDPR